MAVTLLGCGASVPTTTAAQAEDPVLAIAREEKLARDVYRALGRRHALPIFERIAEAEQRHLDAVSRQLDSATHDALHAMPEGRFGAPAVDALYAELVTRGERSELAAIEVGLLIEEMDLADLAAVEGALPAHVHANLARGSRNHLRAFHAQLESRGGTYVAQHLSQEELLAIARSPHERGGGRGMGGGRGAGGGRGMGPGGGRGIGN